MANAGELVSAVIAAVEDKLERTDLMTYKATLAYTRAQGHLYEALFWLSNAEDHSKIIRP
jgi:hypothetical protein